MRQAGPRRAVYKVYRLWQAQLFISDSYLSAKALHASKKKKEPQERWVCRRGTMAFPPLRMSARAVEGPWLPDGSLQDKPPAAAEGVRGPGQRPGGRGRGERDAVVRYSNSQSMNRGDSSSPQARDGGGLGLAASCEEMPPQGGFTGSPLPAGRQGGPRHPTQASKGSRPSVPKPASSNCPDTGLPTPSPRLLHTGHVLPSCKISDPFK